MSSSTLKLPGRGKTVNVTVPDDATASFDFDTAKATFERQGNDLVISSSRQGTLVLDDFFLLGDGTADLPGFVLEDGTTVKSAELLAKLNPNIDVSPAMGPSASTGGGVGEYSDGTGDLLDGVDRLGDQDGFYWAGDSARATLELAAKEAVTESLEPQAPPSGITIEPKEPGGSTPPGGLDVKISGSAGFVLTADEAYLPGGTSHGGAPAQESSVAYIITSNDGVASVTINGVTYPVNPDGTLAGFNSSAASCGSITGARLTQVGEGRYELELTYRFEQPHGGHTSSGKDTAAGVDGFEIYVTSESGVSSESSKVQVDVIDDVPLTADDDVDVTSLQTTISGNVLTGKYGDDPANLDQDCGGADQFGADGMLNGNLADAFEFLAGNTIILEKADGEVQLNFDSLTGKLTDATGQDYGNLQLNTDGTYTYTRPQNADGNTAEFEGVLRVDYMITDGDGDEQQASLNLDIGKVRLTPSITPNPGGGSGGTDQPGNPGNPEDPAYPGTPGGPSNPNLPAGITLNAADLIVDEAFLADGTKSGSGSAADVNTIGITSGEHLASIEIAGITVNLSYDSNGNLILPDLTGKSAAVGEGTLTITGITRIPGTGEYRVEYKYELNGASDHSANGRDALSHDNLKIKVTDATGDEAEHDFKIVIVDDVAKAEDDALTVTSTAADGQINILNNDDYGADGKADSGSLTFDSLTQITYTPNGAAAITLTRDAQGNLTDSQGNDYGKLEINASTGLVTYTRPNEAGGDAKEMGGKFNIGYTIKDGDGDTSSAELELTVDKKTITPNINPNPGGGTGGTDQPGNPGNPEDPAYPGTPGGPVNPNLPSGITLAAADLIVDEAFLANGTKTGSGSASDVNTIGITSGERLASIEIGGITVNLSYDSDGNLILPDLTTMSHSFGNGTLTITGITREAGTGNYRVEYKYELNAASNHSGAGRDGMVHDNLTIRVTDATGEDATHSFKVVVVDDVAKATDDSLVLDSTVASVSGSVISGEYTSTDRQGGTATGSSSAQADQFGADGQAASNSIVFGSTFLYRPADGSPAFTLSRDAQGNLTHNGQSYGKLVLNSDGSYVYTRPTGSGAADINGSINLDYTITDGDGDSSTAGLSITLGTLRYSGRAVIYGQDAENSGGDLSGYNVVADLSGWQGANGLAYHEGDGTGLLSHSLNGDVVTFTLTEAGLAYLKAHGSIEVYYKVIGPDGKPYYLQVVVPGDGEFDSQNYVSKHSDSGYDSLTHGEWHGGKVDSDSMPYDVSSTNMDDEMTFAGLVKDSTIETGDAASKAWGDDSVTVNGALVNSSVTSGSGDDAITVKGHVSGSTINAGSSSAGGKNLIDVTARADAGNLNAHGEAYYGVKNSSLYATDKDTKAGQGDISIKSDASETGKAFVGALADGATTTLQGDKIEVAVTGSGASGKNGAVGLEAANSGILKVDAEELAVNANAKAGNAAGLQSSLGGKIDIEVEGEAKIKASAENGYSYGLHTSGGAASPAETSLKAGKIDISAENTTSGSSRTAGVYNLRSTTTLEADEISITAKGPLNAWGVHSQGSPDGKGVFIDAGATGSVFVKAETESGTAYGIQADDEKVFVEGKDVTVQAFTETGKAYGLDGGSLKGETVSLAAQRSDQNYIAASNNGQGVIYGVNKGSVEASKLVDIDVVSEGGKAVGNSTGDIKVTGAGGEINITAKSGKNSVEGSGGSLSADKVNIYVEGLGQKGNYACELTGMTGGKIEGRNVNIEAKALNDTFHVSVVNRGVITADTLDLKAETKGAAYGVEGEGNTNIDVEDRMTVALKGGSYVYGISSDAETVVDAGKLLDMDLVSGDDGTGFSLGNTGSLKVRADDMDVDVTASRTGRLMRVSAHDSDSKAEISGVRGDMKVTAEGDAYGVQISANATPGAKATLDFTEKLTLEIEGNHAYGFMNSHANIEVNAPTLDVSVTGTGGEALGMSVFAANVSQDEQNFVSTNVVTGDTISFDVSGYAKAHGMTAIAYSESDNGKVARAENTITTDGDALELDFNVTSANGYANFMRAGEYNQARWSSTAGQREAVNQVIGAGNGRDVVNVTVKGDSYNLGATNDSYTPTSTAVGMLARRGGHNLVDKVAEFNLDVTARTGSAHGLHAENLGAAYGYIEGAASNTVQADKFNLDVRSGGSWQSTKVTGLMAENGDTANLVNANSGAGGIANPNSIDVSAKGTLSGFDSYVAAASAYADGRVLHGEARNVVGNVDNTQEVKLSAESDGSKGAAFGLRAETTTQGWSGAAYTFTASSEVYSAGKVDIDAKLTGTQEGEHAYGVFAYGTTVSTASNVIKGKEVEIDALTGANTKNANAYGLHAEYKTSSNSVSGLDSGGSKLAVNAAAQGQGGSAYGVNTQDEAKTSISNFDQLHIGASAQSGSATAVRTAGNAESVIRGKDVNIEAEVLGQGGGAYGVNSQDRGKTTVENFEQIHISAEAQNGDAMALRASGSAENLIKGKDVTIGAKSASGLNTEGVRSEEYGHNSIEATGDVRVTVAQGQAGDSYISGAQAIGVYTRAAGETAISGKNVTIDVTGNAAVATGVYANNTSAGATRITAEENLSIRAESLTSSAYGVQGQSKKSTLLEGETVDITAKSHAGSAAAVSYASVKATGDVELVAEGLGSTRGTYGASGKDDNYIEGANVKVTAQGGGEVRGIMSATVKTLNDGDITVNATSSGLRVYGVQMSALDAGQGDVRVNAEVTGPYTGSGWGANYVSGIGGSSVRAKNLEVNSKAVDIRAYGLSDRLDIEVEKMEIRAESNNAYGMCDMLSSTIHADQALIEAKGSNVYGSSAHGIGASYGLSDNIHEMSGDDWTIKAQAQGNATGIWMRNNDTLTMNVKNLDMTTLEGAHDVYGLEMREGNFRLNGEKLDIYAGLRNGGSRLAKGISAETQNGSKENSDIRLNVDNIDITAHGGAAEGIYNFSSQVKVEADSFKLRAIGTENTGAQLKESFGIRQIHRSVSGGDRPDETTLTEIRADDILIQVSSETAAAYGISNRVEDFSTEPGEGGGNVLITSKSGALNLDLDVTSTSGSATGLHASGKHSEAAEQQDSAAVNRIQGGSAGDVIDIDVRGASAVGMDALGDGHNIVQTDGRMTLDVVSSDGSAYGIRGNSDGSAYYIPGVGSVLYKFEAGNTTQVKDLDVTVSGNSSNGAAKIVGIDAREGDVRNKINSEGAPDGNTVDINVTGSLNNAYVLEGTETEQQARWNDHAGYVAALNAGAHHTINYGNAYNLVGDALTTASVNLKAENTGEHGDTYGLRASGYTGGYSGGSLYNYAENQVAAAGTVKLDVLATNSQYQGDVYGLYAASGSNSGAKNSISGARVTVNVSNAGSGNAYGMYVESSSNVITGGDIGVHAVAASGDASAMLAKSGGNQINASAADSTFNLSAHSALGDAYGMNGAHGSNGIKSGSGLFDLNIKATADSGDAYGVYSNMGSNVIDALEGRLNLTVEAGGAGSGDRYSLYAYGGDVTIQSGAQEDVIWLKGELAGVNGGEISIDTGAGYDQVTVNGSILTSFAPDGSDAGTVRISLGGGDDLLTLNGGTYGGAVFDGGSGTDKLMYNLQDANAANSVNDELQVFFESNTIMGFEEIVLDLANGSNDALDLDALFDTLKGNADLTNGTTIVINGDATGDSAVNYGTYGTGVTQGDYHTYTHTLDTGEQIQIMIHNSFF